MTSLLFIALGVSLGVGGTLLFLQEKFLRERRKLAAALEGEKEKAQNMLAELDQKWEQETASSRNELEQSRRLCDQLEEEKRLWFDERQALEDRLTVEETVAKSEADVSADQSRLEELEKEARFREEVIENLQKEKEEFVSALDNARQEIAELHSEREILNGSIQKLKDQQKNRPERDDFFVQRSGDHIIPGSVARALMGKK